MAGIYATHVRGEGDTILDSVREAIEIGEKANVALLAIAGVTYEAIASARDRRVYPPPGRLVDIDGR